MHLRQGMAMLCWLSTQILVATLSRVEYVAKPEAGSQIPELISTSRAHREISMRKNLSVLASEHLHARNQNIHCQALNLLGRVRESRVQKDIMAKTSRKIAGPLAQINCNYNQLAQAICTSELHKYLAEFQVDLQMTSEVSSEKELCERWGIAVNSWKLWKLGNLGKRRIRL